MSSLGSFSCNPGTGITYKLDIEFENDHAITDIARIRINASKEEEKSQEFTDVTFGVTIENNEGAQISIDREGEIITEIRHEAVEKADLPEPLNDSWWENFQELVADPDALGHAIETVPAFDPVVGCLIRSGLSTSVEHILKCYRDHKDAGEWQKVLNNTVKCLGQHTGGIVWTFVWRTGRCVIFAGT